MLCISTVKGKNNQQDRQTKQCQGEILQLLQPESIHVMSFAKDEVSQQQQQNFCLEGKVHDYVA